MDACFLALIFFAYHIIRQSGGLSREGQVGILALIEYAGSGSHAV